MFYFPDKIPENLEYDIKSLEEEKANFYSHFAGILFILFSGTYLFYNVSETDNLWGVLVYIFTFLVLFSTSTWYHNSYVLAIRKKLRILDHVAIYFFIAGTYTPVILKYVQDSVGMSVLIGLWSITLVGTIFKIFFVGRFRIVSTIIYLAMGWTGIFLTDRLLEVMPISIFYWIVLGGVFYTLGTFFYIKKSIKYNHLYWHFAVLFGAIAHFVAVYLSYT